MIKDIDQVFPAQKVSGEILDALLAGGWRHGSDYFFRMNKTVHDEKTFNVIPLRIVLSDFKLSKSQRRTVNKNIDTHLRIAPTSFSKEKLELFEKHKKRFGLSAPESLSVYLSEAPERFPCTNYEFCIYESNRLIAVSFLDVGNEASSALYAMFDPGEQKRSLGIYTMLKEIEWSVGKGMKYYYPGYAYAEESFYDYKKNFFGLESYDWETGRWKRFAKMGLMS